MVAVVKLNRDFLSRSPALETVTWHTRPFTVVAEDEKMSTDGGDGKKEKSVEKTQTDETSKPTASIKVANIYYLAKEINRWPL